MIVKQALLAFALAFFAESLVEYVFAGPLAFAKVLLVAKSLLFSDALEAAEPLKYIALCVGVGMAFAYSLDLLNVAFEIVADPAWVGILLTGMAIGRGSNYVHDLWKRYLDPGHAQLVATLQDFGP